MSYARLDNLTYVDPGLPGAYPLAVTPYAQLQLQADSEGVWLRFMAPDGSIWSSHRLLWR